MIFGASRPRHPRSSTRASRATADAVHSAEELPPKLAPSLKQLAATAASIAHTRLSLAGLELEEEVHRLVSAAAQGIVALILVSLALVVGTFTIVAAAPVEYRVVTMIIITVVYVAIAWLLVVRVKAIFTNRPPLFEATLAELEKDKEALAQMARAHEAEEEARERERARGRDEEAFASVYASDPKPATQGAI